MVCFITDPFMSFLQSRHPLHLHCVVNGVNHESYWTATAEGIAHEGVFEIRSKRCEAASDLSFF